MSVDPDRASAALAPLRAALIERARADAAATVAEADDRAAQAVAAAEREAAHLVAHARAEAAADAEHLLARERAATRRQAQFLVLSARREAYEALRREARRAVGDLRAEAGYPRLWGALAARARETLGPDAVVHPDAPDQPGVVAEAAGRRLDLSLAALADAALEELAPGVEQLWA